MLRKRRGNGSVVIYRLFLVAMIAAVIFFVMRIASGKLETDFSAGQIMHLTKSYQMGDIYDRSGKMIAKGGKNSREEYES